MRTKTQRTLLRLATATAVMCTAAVIFLPTVVSAQPTANAALAHPSLHQVISSLGVR